MNTKKLFCYVFVVLLGGCVPVLSLHPLYTEGDVVPEKRLLGVWVDDPNSPDTTWEFRNIEEPNNAYKLIFSDEEGKKGSFVARVVKLQDKLFMDVYPSEMPSDVNDPAKTAWPYNAFFLIPAHSFLRLDSVEPQLKMRLMLESKVKELLTEQPDIVKHTSAGERLVLTAPTKELQTFILKYADNERVFTDEVTLSRKPAPVAEEKLVLKVEGFNVTVSADGQRKITYDDVQGKAGVGTSEEQAKTNLVPVQIGKDPSGCSTLFIEQDAPIWGRRIFYLDATSGVTLHSVMRPLFDISDLETKVICGDNGAREEIANFLNHESAIVRRDAAEMLGRVGNKKSLPRIKAVLDREKLADVRSAMQRAIAKLAVLP